MKESCAHPTEKTKMSRISAGGTMKRRNFVCESSHQSETVLYREILHMCLQILLNLVRVNDLLVLVCDDDNNQ